MSAAALAGRKAEVTDIAISNGDAYAAVAVDFNKDGGSAGIDDLDFFDANPEVKNVTTEAEADEYDAAQAELAAAKLAKQQALDNYTGDGKLPEGSDESHIQKRLQFWQDNPSVHFSGVGARNTEFNQIKQDYGTELGKLDLSALGIMDLDNDNVPDSADTDKDGDGVVNNVDLLDRKSVVQGKSVDLGGRRIIKKKNSTQNQRRKERQR